MEWGEFKTDTEFELTHEELLDLLPAEIGTNILFANTDETIKIDEFHDSRKRKQSSSSMGFFSAPAPLSSISLPQPIFTQGSHGSPPSTP